MNLVERIDGQSCLPLFDRQSLYNFRPNPRSGYKRDETAGTRPAGGTDAPGSNVSYAS